jgi:uncharacterized membrane protein YfcA
MSILSFTAIVWLASFVAGLLGSLTGLGGGVVIVPLLVIAFGIDIRYAVGASLVSVIATSSGAAAAFVRDGYANIRLGLFLEIATTIGALSGAALAPHLSARGLSLALGVALIYSAIASHHADTPNAVEPSSDRYAHALRLNSTYPSPTGPCAYAVRRTPLGFAIMYVAGILSGLLGIGSGAVKVLAMDRAMGLPFKVSTTTSNFMIGVTAAASAGVYLNRGYIDPGLVMPVMLGVLCGALVGARVLDGARVGVLRLLFSCVIVVLGLEMLYSGIKGTLG